MRPKFVRQVIDFFRLPESVKFKWGGTVLSEGFVPFPKKLLRTMGRLFDGAEGLEELNVLLAIADYKRPANPRPPSLEYLAFLAGLGEERTAQILGRLKARKFITMEEDPSGRLNVDYLGFMVAIEEATAAEDLPTYHAELEEAARRRVSDEDLPF